MGSRGSCQIGGVIATNAGGIRVIQSGTARENVVGLEVVLADGAILSSMSKMTKNNTGYDLKHWFIGSEGTLGVITRAVLRLRPKPFGCHTALCALSDYRAMADLLARMRTGFGTELAAFEIMLPDFFDFGVEVSRAKSLARLRRPSRALRFGGADHLESRRRRTTALSELLNAAADAGTILDAVVAHSTS